MQRSTGRKVFVVFNMALMILISFSCLLPFVHVLALSLSSAAEAAAGRVILFPRQIHPNAYIWVLGRPEIWRSLGVSFFRVALGLAVNLFLTLITAYPLSKDSTVFRPRTAYAWYFFFTVLFSGGLIPSYLMVKNTGLMDNILALILPGAVPVFNIILLLNFFRSVPRDLEEAAFIDGAGHARVLFQIYVPVSMPAIATISLFTIVGHWNSWFDGMIYMNSTANYPFQSYLRTLILSTDVGAIRSVKEMEFRILLSDRTIKSAQIILGALPVMIIYPFLQKFFVKGIIIGSVKG